MPDKTVDTPGMGEQPDLSSAPPPYQPSFEPNNPAVSPVVLPDVAIPLPPPPSYDQVIGSFGDVQENSGTMSSPTQLPAYSPEEVPVKTPPDPPPPDSPPPAVTVVEAINEDPIPTSLPAKELRSLHDKIYKKRWVVPLLPEQELAVLILAARQIVLHAKAPVSSEPSMQQFLCKVLPRVFVCLMKDDAVKEWNPSVLDRIFVVARDSVRLYVAIIQLEGVNAPVDVFNVLLDIFTSTNKFHNHVSSMRTTTVSTYPPQSTQSSQSTTVVRPQTESGDSKDQPEEILPNPMEATDGKVVLDEPPLVFASHPVKTRLVELLNLFGSLGGFDAIRKIGLEVEKKFEQVFQTDSSAATPSGDVAEDEEHSSASVTSSTTTTIVNTGATSSTSPTSKTTNNDQREVAELLIRPFRYCMAFLEGHVVETYIKPILHLLATYVDSLDIARISAGSFFKPGMHVTDFPLYNCLTTVKFLVTSVGDPDQSAEGNIHIEQMHLRLLLRLLQSSPFAQRIQVVDELTDLIDAAMDQYPRWTMNRTQRVECLRQAGVVKALLQDNLHQTAYIDRIRNMLSILLNKNQFSESDLETVWTCKEGKHDTIQRNVHQMIIALTGNMSSQLLHCLLNHVCTSWRRATTHERQLLLDFIYKMACEESGRQDFVAHVAELLWTFSRDETLGDDAVDQILICQANVLKAIAQYNIRQHSLISVASVAAQCVGDQSPAIDVHCVPGLRHVQCVLNYLDSTPAWNSQSGGAIGVWNNNYANDYGKQRSSDDSMDAFRPGTSSANQPGTSGASPTGTGHQLTKRDLIEQFLDRTKLIQLICLNVRKFMHAVRALSPDMTTPGDKFMIDQRYSYVQHLSARLNLIHYLLKATDRFLELDLAELLWAELIRAPIFGDVDRNLAFEFFVQLIEHQFIVCEQQGKFFDDHMLNLKPSWITNEGLGCFRKMFIAVNFNAGKLDRVTADNTAVPNSNNHENEFICDTTPGCRLIVTDLALHGFDYLWSLILECRDEVFNDAVALLCDVLCVLVDDPAHVTRVNEMVINEARERLRTLFQLMRSGAAVDDSTMAKVSPKILRVLHALAAYIDSFDLQYPYERLVGPLNRATIGESFEISCVLVTSSSSHRSAFAGPYSNPMRSKPSYSRLFSLTVHSNQTLITIRKIIKLKLDELRTSTDSCSSPERCGSPAEWPVSGGGHLTEQLAQLHDYHLYHDGSLLNCDADQRTLQALDLCTDDTTIELHPSTGDPPSRTADSSSPSSPTDADMPRPRLHYSSAGAVLEMALPGVQIAQNDELIHLLINIGQLSEVHVGCAQLAYAGKLLQLLPAPKAISSACEKWFLSVDATLLERSRSSIMNEYVLAVLLSHLLPSHTQSLSLSLVAGVLRNFDAMRAQLCDILTAYTTVNESTDLAPNSNSNLAPTNQHHAAVAICVRLLKYIYFVRLVFAVRVGRPIEEVAKVIFYAILQDVPSDDDLCAREVLQSATNAVVESSPPYVNLMQVVDGVESAANDQVMQMTMRVLSAVGETSLDADWHAPLADDSIELQLMACVSHEFIADAVTRANDVYSVAAQLMTGDHMLVIVKLVCSDNDQISHVTRCAVTRYMEHLAIRAGGVLTRLVAQLLAYAQTMTNCSLNMVSLMERLLQLAELSPETVIEYLRTELSQLNAITDFVSSTQQSYDNVELLCLRLTIVDALLEKLPADVKTEYGPGIIELVLCDLLTPSARSYYAAAVHSRGITRSATLTADLHAAAPSDTHMPRSATTCMAPSGASLAVCNSPDSTRCAYQVLCTLCHASHENIQLLLHTLNAMCTTNKNLLTEWEYSPSFSLRAPHSYVGLKNPSSTCYMNSVLQQLFMLDKVRQAVLYASGPVVDLDDETELPSAEAVTSGGDSGVGTADDVSVKSPSATDERASYNIRVMRCVQWIFAKLLASQQQCYEPRAFWSCFRLGGQRISVREQQDAFEFFDSLVDALDAGLKAVGDAPICEKVFGITLADEKIGRSCPHRHESEQTLTSVPVDVRPHRNLLDSLSEYVKADLLENDNAYHCSACDKKVDAFKRVSIKRLPDVLIIHAKRFAFDYDRNLPVKRNDYFEFPRNLDMKPYTTYGLTKQDQAGVQPSTSALSVCEPTTSTTSSSAGVDGGKQVCDSGVSSPGADVQNDSQMDDSDFTYVLRGIVVHSGYVSGGHYYSYITTDRDHKSWYRFDDRTVTECDLHLDQKLREACFGGSESSSYSYRSEKTYSAYLLVYERIREQPDASVTDISSSVDGSCDPAVWNTSTTAVSAGDVTQSQSTQFTSVLSQLDKLSMSGSRGPLAARKMPAELEAIINKHNSSMVHEHSQYTSEFFFFIREFITAAGACCQLHPPTAGHDQIVQFATEFVFNKALHTKREIRGPASEWLIMFLTLMKPEHARQLFVSTPVWRSKVVLGCLLEATEEVRTAVFHLLEKLIRRSAAHEGRKALEAGSVAGRLVHDYVSLLANQGAREQIVRKPALYFAMFDRLLIIKSQQPVTAVDEQLRHLMYALLNQEDLLTKLVKFVITETTNRYRFDRNDFRTLFSIIEKYCKFLVSLTVDQHVFADLQTDEDALFIRKRAASDILKEETRQILLSDKFLRALLDCCPLDEAQQIVDCLCYDNIPYTEDVLEPVILEQFNQNIQMAYSLDSTKWTLQVVQSVLKLNDRFQSARLKLFIYGREREEEMQQVEDDEVDEQMVSTSKIAGTGLCRTTSTHSSSEWAASHSQSSSKLNQTLIDEGNENEDSQTDDAGPSSTSVAVSDSSLALTSTSSTNVTSTSDEPNAQSSTCDTQQQPVVSTIVRPKRRIVHGGLVRMAVQQLESSPGTHDIIMSQRQRALQRANCIVDMFHSLLSTPDMRDALSRCDQTVTLTWQRATECHAQHVASKVAAQQQHELRRVGGRAVEHRLETMPSVASRGGPVPQQPTTPRTASDPEPASPRTSPKVEGGPDTDKLMSQLKNLQKSTEPEDRSNRGQMFTELEDANKAP